MNAGLIDRIETNVERAASAIFAGAVGYAAYGLLGGIVPLPELAACAAAAAIIANLLCTRTLAAASRRRVQHRVPVFDVRDIEPEAMDELVLSDSDRLPDTAELVLSDSDRLNPDELLLADSDRLQPGSHDPLVLDDILAELGPDSRVVRLFDRKAMPTPGQLKRRIDSHLEEGSGVAGGPDASQALSDALAELRRSLR